MGIVDCICPTLHENKIKYRANFLTVHVIPTIYLDLHQKMFICSN